MKPKLLRKPKLTDPPKLKKSAKPPSNWGLYESDGYPNWGLSYSLLSKFVVCRERFRLRTVEGLVPSGTKEAMEFGTIFHKVLELYAQGKTYTQILTYFRKRTRQHRKQYDPLLCQIAATILPYYTEYWKKVLSEIDYFETEKVFSLEYTCSLGKTVTIRGKRDEGFRKDGRIWLQENKTMSMIREEQIIQTLHAMLQPMVYLLSFLTDHPGKPIGGVLYNCIRKPGLKQGGKETDKQFLERITKDIEARPDHYFKMFEIPVTEHEVHEWTTKYFDPLICQVVLWWESIKHNPFDPWVAADGSPNVHHFIRPFGVFDPMSVGLGDYFSRVVQGHDAGLERNDNIFPELQEDD